MGNCTILFVKYPEPGEVKTRLAEDSSPEGAAEFYKVFVQDKLAELGDLANSELIVFYAPETRKKDMGEWLGTTHRFIAQKGAELGRRMENAFREVFFMGFDRVILIGSDIPGLTPAIISTAFASLEQDKPCLGPAEDGGYYLIGFHRHGFAPLVFRDMEWSEDDVYQRTVNRFTDTDITFTELDRLDDMDTLEDVETMVALGRNGPLKGRLLELARKLIGM